MDRLKTKMLQKVFYVTNSNTNMKVNNKRWKPSRFRTSQRLKNTGKKNCVKALDEEELNFTVFK